MNDNEFKNNNQVKNIYRATSNLNTAIDNPQIDIDGAVDVNIKDIDPISNHSFNYGNQFNESQDFNFSNNNGMINSQNIQNNSQSNFETAFQENQNAGFNSNIYDNMLDNQNNFGNFQSDSDSNFHIKQDVNVNNSQFISSSESSHTLEQTNDYVVNNESQVTYEPTIKEKKRHNKNFEIPRELKLMLFIVFIIFIFILVIPYIYDFFKEIKLIIMNS